MNNNRTTCDPERIELFLQQKLRDAEQTEFELHLDDCDDCRRRLEATAAGDDIWSGVRDSLRGEELPPDGQRGDSALDSATGDEASSSQTTVLKLLAPTDDDRMIGRWGTYEVVGVIGTGGMGVVLKAFEAALNRYVAIKILAPHLGNTVAARKRFSREAQAAAAVVHDNVIEIHGVAEAAGLPYLVMPYVRGPSLQRRLDGEGPLALVEILRVGMQAAAGLAAAHAQGLVHRDVKPANILLADGVERVKLTDFGLARAADDARLTKTGIIAGTPQYMSPEQARGEAVDQRSDLFSLGSVLYAMCTGRAPFRAETSYGVLRRITDDEPRPIREINPEIPEWSCRVVAKLMSKHPDNRFQSAREVAGLLEECLAHVQQPTVMPLPAALPKPAPRRAWWPPVLRFKGVIAMIAAFGAGLLGVLALSTAPPDIAGQWTGEDWGQVVLTPTAAGEYSGTFSDTVTKEPGNIALRWSRIERRFNGAWSEGKKRYGDLSLRLVGDDIRGALTTDPKSKINPATPRLADLTWHKLVQQRGPRRNAGDRTEAASTAKPVFDLHKPIAGKNFVIVPFRSEAQRVRCRDYEQATHFVFFNGRALINENDSAINLGALDMKRLHEATQALVRAHLLRRVHVEAVMGTAQVAIRREYYEPASYYLHHILGQLVPTDEVDVHLGGSEREWKVLAADLATRATEEDIRAETGLGDDLVKIYPVRTPLSRYLYDCDYVVFNVKPYDELTPADIHALPERAKNYIAQLGFPKTAKVCYLENRGKSHAKGRRASNELWGEWTAKVGEPEVICTNASSRGTTLPRLTVEITDENGRSLKDATVTAHYLFEQDLRVDERDIKFEKQGDGRWRSTPLGPNDEFTLTVTAPGYQSNSQQFSLPGEESGRVTRNRTVKLKK